MQARYESPRFINRDLFDMKYLNLFFRTLRGHDGSINMLLLLVACDL